jgi:hypothetical protein
MCAVSGDDTGSWIDQLYAKPGYTGKGIGTSLLDEAIPLLNLPVRLYTFQASTRARSFYERYGFKAVKFSDGSGNEEMVPDVLSELTARRIIVEMLEETVRSFLERYDQALGAGDLPGVAACWQVPAMVLSDEGARPVQELAEVEQFFAGAVEWYRSQGLVATRPQLLHVQALGQRLISTDARWSTLNAAGLEVASETSRNILSLGEDNLPRIRVAISITV